MSCASVSRVVEEELELLRRRLLARLPDLAFIAIVAGSDDCDDKRALHVETQVAVKPGFPLSMRADVMESAARQVRAGKVQRPPS